MRIAYLCADRGIALGGHKGASVHMAEITAALARSGAEVLLLPTSVLGPRKRARGITVEPLPAHGTDVEISRRLASRLRSFGADVLYERLALHTQAGVLTARRLGIPHVVELNSPLSVEAARYRSRTLRRPGEAARLERLVLGETDLVLAVSGPVAAYARERGATRVEVVPNAVDARRFTAAAPGEARCVFLGALRPWHGIGTIADAWRLLGSDAPPLLVVGDGPGRAALESVGAEVVGPVSHDHVPALLARATIGLAPYAPDAPGYFSPLKLFEYLAAGLAVVAGAIEGVREVVGSEHAVLVPPGDARGLAAAVSTLSRDSAARAALGAAGRRLVVADHTWDARARRILDLLPELQLARAS